MVLKQSYLRRPNLHNWKPLICLFVSVLAVIGFNALAQTGGNPSSATGGQVEGNPTAGVGNIPTATNVPGGNITTGTHKITASGGIGVTGSGWSPGATTPTELSARAGPADSAGSPVANGGLPGGDIAGGLGGGSLAGSIPENEDFEEDRKIEKYIDSCVGKNFGRFNLFIVSLFSFLFSFECYLFSEKISKSISLKDISVSTKGLGRFTLFSAIFCLVIAFILSVFTYKDCMFYSGYYYLTRDINATLLYLLSVSMPGTLLFSSLFVSMLALIKMNISFLTVDKNEFPKLGKLFPQVAPFLSIAASIFTIIKNSIV